MRGVIEPKSDQINADDFMGGPKTYRIAGVSITPGSEQPVTIDLEGSKPWRPCKSMSRLLVAAWGADAKEYAGRSVTLYRDPKVKWGGLEVGGMTKGKRAPYTVKPLKIADVRVIEKKPDMGNPITDDAEPFDVTDFGVVVDMKLRQAIDPDALTAWWDNMKPSRLQARAADKTKAGEIATRVAAKIAELTADLEGA
jgi:hypothetical protein